MRKQRFLKQVFYLGMATVIIAGSGVGCSSVGDQGKESIKQRKSSFHWKKEK